jgi:hypothetical protein
MFAQSSWFLANLENIEVIKLISQVNKDLSKLLYLFFKIVHDFLYRNYSLTGNKRFCKR